MYFLIRSSISHNNNNNKGNRKYFLGNIMVYEHLYFWKAYFFISCCSCTLRPKLQRTPMTISNINTSRLYMISCRLIYRIILYQLFYLIPNRENQRIPTSNVWYLVKRKILIITREPAFRTSSSSLSRPPVGAITFPFPTGFRPVFAAPIILL